MTWLKLILTAIANFLKWRVQATDPAAKAQEIHEEEHKKWQQKLERLEREEAEVNAVIENRIAAHHAGATDDWRDYTILELQAIVERRRKAVSDHHRQEPRNPAAQRG